MRIPAIATAAFIALVLAASIAPARDSFVEVGENLWVTFYDVPSYRFRSTRDAFVRRDFETVRRDLETSASHVTIESGRSSPELTGRLADVGQQMLAISNDLENSEITAEALDKLFARTHWLLAQHYLFHARISRDANNNPMAGRYLWATTHHMERATLWSNARISRKLLKSLEELRDLAIQLQNRQLAAAAREAKPVLRAEAVLKEIGKQIDRPVVLKIE